MCKYVAYYRVSTKRQGRSGLGLDAQRETIMSYLRGREGAQVVGEYVEVESGRNADRPKLAEAIQHAKNANAVLVVAKLDRLARSVSFISALRESGCKFVAADLPEMTDLTLHIFAALAEYEAKRISERTRDALKAAKRRGKLLGSARPGHWKGREERRIAGASTASKIAARLRTSAAKLRNASLVAEAEQYRATGLTWEQVAEQFNEKGYETARGNKWTASAVHQIANRN